MDNSTEIRIAIQQRLQPFSCEEPITPKLLGSFDPSTTPCLFYN